LIELELPERAVALDPRRRVPHRPGDEHRAPHASLTSHARESGPLEDAHVLRDRRERHREARRELADRALARRKSPQNRPPRWIGERSESGIERLGMVNHTV